MKRAKRAAGAGRSRWSRPLGAGGLRRRRRRRAATAAARARAEARSPSCCRRRRRPATRRRTSRSSSRRSRSSARTARSSTRTPTRIRPSSSQQVEAAVTEGVDVIVLDPVDSTSAAGMVTRAKQADIPVISYDRLILDADLATTPRSTAPRSASSRARRSPKARRGRLPQGPDRADQRRPEGQQRQAVQGGRERVFEEEGIESRRSTTRPTGCPRTPSRRWSRRSPRVGEDGFTRRLRRQRRHRRRRDRGAEGAGIDPQTIPVTGQDAELAAIQRIIAGEQYMTVYKPIKPLAESAASSRSRSPTARDPADRT